MHTVLSALAALVLLSPAARAERGVETRRPAADGDAPDRAAYVERVVERAMEDKLYTEEQWIRLGHYRRGFFGGKSSEADGMGFFLDEDGPDDPKGELKATIRAFFRPDPTEDDMHALCRFPARFDWLDRQLSFEPSLLPSPSCPRRDRFLESVNAHSATIVFSSYYLGNAASAFGHTLLRLNKSSAATGGERRELLDTGINYSAAVDTGSAILYALKGLTGLFKGNFQRLPYYYKVRQYNDFESRDLWEYELNLRGEKLGLLVKHIWELGGTYFDYYYLTENCSYHLLAAIEAADPEIDLLGELGWPVIPADTVKALLSEKGLVTDVKFRPSLRSQFKARLGSLSPRQREVARALRDDADADARGLSREGLAAALDVAIDGIDMLHGKDMIAEPKSEMAERRLALMIRRAELAIPSKELEVSVPAAKAPHRGHDSRRFGIGAGMRGDTPYGRVQARLAMHDMADSTRGFPELAQLEFLPTLVSYNFVDERAQVERFSLVTVRNLSPLTSFERKFSWQIDVGGHRLRDRGCTDCFMPRLKFAAGASLGSGDQRYAAFLLAALEAGGHPDIDALGPMRVGTGGILGARASLTADLVLLVEGELLRLWREDPAYSLRTSSILRWQYGIDQALSAEAGYLRPTLGGELDASLAWLLYF